jgi:hypothetical protein
MKKSLLLIICSLSALAGAAQTYVSVSNFNANIGSSATTVTFNVSWTSAGNDSVWVFVDYNTQGTMKRLPLTGATTTLGTVHRPDNNNQGAWVIAPASGEFATTVTLSSGTTYSYGSCAYAIPQPPTGQYTAYNVIKFTGTPPFDLTFKDAGGSVSVAAGTYTLPAGKTPASFTDATRAPGIIRCKAPAVYTLNASSSTYCADVAGVTLALSNTEPGATYTLYKGDVSTGATLAPNGGAATFSGSYKTDAYSAKTVASQAFCAATAGTRTIVEQALPTVWALTASMRTCNTQASDAIFALSGTQAGVTYQLYRDNAAITGADATLTGTGSAATFSNSFGVTGTYTAQAKTAVAACTATMSGSHNVAVTTTLPTLPTSPTSNSRFDAGTVTFSASVPTGHTIDWYDVPTGGSPVNSATTSFASTLTGAPPYYVRTYYAESRNTANGCVSAFRTPVDGCISPFASCRTWTISGTTWSDRLIYKPDNCASVTGLTNITTPAYVIYGARIYYNGYCVNEVKASLCPNPWRILSNADVYNVAALPDDIRMAIVTQFGWDGRWISDICDTCNGKSYTWTGECNVTAGACGALRYVGAAPPIIPELILPMYSSLSMGDGASVRCVKN